MPHRRLALKDAVDEEDRRRAVSLYAKDDRPLRSRRKISRRKDPLSLVSRQRRTKKNQRPDGGSAFHFSQLSLSGESAGTITRHATISALGSVSSCTESAVVM